MRPQPPSEALVERPRDTETLLFVDGSAGASGDMWLGALVDLGVPAAYLRRELAALKLDPWTLRSRRVQRCGLAARKIDLRIRPHGKARGWKQIERVIRRAGLPEPVRERSLAVFRRLIEAEAGVHGVTFEKAHLHEAGADDALLDVVGTCLGLHRLEIDRIVASPVVTGFGRVECSHGSYPVPAPATLQLLCGFPTLAGNVEAERLTPTGAALLTTLADAWGPLPAMRPRKIGYGAGGRDLDGTPNAMRLVLGDSPRTHDTAVADAHEVEVIECTLDDATPQLLAFVAERLLEAGALDVFMTPVLMKKGRPGQTLTVLARPDRHAELTALILRETPTLGLRWRTETRVELSRERVEVTTRFGKIGIKQATLDGQPAKAWPEYEECATLALRHDVPLREVQQAALRAHQRRNKLKD